MNLSQERIPDSALELELVYEKGALLRLPRKYMGDIACSTVSGAWAAIIIGDWSGDLWAGGYVIHYVWGSQFGRQEQLEKF